MKNYTDKFDKECLQFYDKRKKVTVEENTKKFIVNNSDQKYVALYRVDDCLITNGSRCDYLLLNCFEDDLSAYLIELKGSNLTQAVKQIDATLARFKEDLEDFKKINARIVLTKVNFPATLKSIDLRNLRKKIALLGGTLEYKVKVLEEKI